MIISTVVLSRSCIALFHSSEIMFEKFTLASLFSLSLLARVINLKMKKIVFFLFVLFVKNLSPVAAGPSQLKSVQC